MLDRFGWFFSISCLVLAGCGGTTEFGRPEGDGGPDAPSTPDPACLAFCTAKRLECWGSDAANGTGTITETTANGCSVEVKLDVNGTMAVTLDCTAKKVCLDRYPDYGCYGEVGKCYDANDTSATSFGYFVSGCLQGSLSCSVTD
jgi:hypothetical protein